MRKIDLEKRESDALWEIVLNDVLNGRINAQEIALAIHRCNEVDKMILKISHDNFEQIHL